jgi:hypothetical protein
MCGSLAPKAHRESPPRRENTGSGSRINGSTQASGLDPHPKGYAGSGSVIVRRTSMNTCTVVKFSVMGSSFVRPKIGPYAIHRPASGPGAYLRSYAGRPPEVNVYWSCGRGPINQRGEPPSSSVPQRSKAVPPGALAMAWAVNRASSVQQCGAGKYSLTSQKGWNGSCYVMPRSQTSSRPESVRSSMLPDG